MRKTTTLCFVILAAAPLAFAQATPPDLVNFQGVLRDSSDAPLDGAFDMTFRFFDAETLGNELLVDSHLAAGSGAVTVTGGLFNVALGSGAVTGVYTSLSEVFQVYGNVWVEVVVGAEVLSPRIRVVSAAYALNAATASSSGDADTLDSLDSTDFAASGHTHTLIAGATDVTATAAEVNRLSGVGPTVTAANLTGLTDGSNADALHAHAAGDADTLDGLDSTDFMSSATDIWVDEAGDTMAGTLNLPANGLVAGTDQLVLWGDNVGVGTATPIHKLDVAGGSIRTSGQLISMIPTGAAPLSVSSSTRVDFLNADLLDGSHSSAFAPSAHFHPSQHALLIHTHMLTSGAIDVVSTAAEVNKLSGTGATVTAANLTGLTDGSNADALHAHNIDGGDAQTLDGFDSSQFLRKDIADTAADVITFNEDIRVGSGSGSDDDYVYFDAAAEYLRWNNGSTRFEFSDELYTGQSMTASIFYDSSSTTYYLNPGGATSGRFYGNVQIGYGLGTDDDIIYFDANGEYLSWDDAPGEFVFSDDLYVQGGHIGVGVAPNNNYGVYSSGSSYGGYFTGTNYGVYGSGPSWGGYFTGTAWGLYTPDNASLGNDTSDRHRFWGYLQSGSTSDAHQIIPNGGNYGFVGTSTLYWWFLYASNVMYKNLGTFDAYPDLDLIDGMKAVMVPDEKTGEVRPIVDPATIPAIIRGTPTPDDPAADQFIDAGKADGLLFGAVRQLRAETKGRDAALRGELDLRTPDKETGRQEMDGNFQIVLDKDANDAARFSVFRDGADGLQEEVFRVDEEGNLYLKGSVRPASLDLAEYHPVSELVEAGDVLVMDPQNPSMLQRCAFESDPRVVGIVSAAPGIELGRSIRQIAAMEPELAARIDDARAVGDKEAEDAAWAQLEEIFKATHAAVALSGTVACKVDAGYGAVEAGDLLVASPTPGHAMKTDSPVPGTVLGKAMGALDAGTGAIKVLVMLR